MQRCVKISKQSVKNFRRFAVMNKRTFTARRAGLDGSISASGSAGPGFDPRRGSKFSFENFQLRS